MKTNVKIYKHTNYDIDVEIKYYVYEKDRKVVCVITNLHREEVELENQFKFTMPSFHFHSMNPVGVENMRRIIEHNRWQEIKNL